jgi:hypothetical protein
MYTHRPDRASVVRISNDGGHVLDRATPVLCTGPTAPTYFAEDLATNAAVDLPDFTYDMGDNSLAPEPEPPESDGISVRVKAKCYTNSVGNP